MEQPYNGGAYQFAYRTGSTQEQDLAQMFREESRDEFGNVQGKYGYVDPNGNMRFEIESFFFFLFFWYENF